MIRSFLVILILSTTSLGLYGQEDFGGTSGTRAFMDALEDRNEAIAQDLENRQVLVNGRVASAEDMLEFGYTTSTAATVWRETGGGPVTQTLGIPIREITESFTFQAFRYLLITTALILSVVLAVNDNSLFTDGMKWIVKAVPATGIMLMPDMIYGMIIGLSNLSTFMVALALGTSSGQNMQARLAMMSGQQQQAANAYIYAHDVAINHMNPYFAHEDVTAQKEINMQLNRWLDDVQANQGIAEEFSALPVEDITAENLGENQDIAFRQFRELSKVMLTEYPVQSGTGGLNRLATLDSIAFPNQSASPPRRNNGGNFDPFKKNAVPNIQRANSPVTYYHEYNPLLLSIRTGERIRNNGDSEKLSDKKVAQYLERFEQGIYQTTRNYYEKILFEPIMVVPAQIAGLASEIASSRENTSNTLNAARNNIKDLKVDPEKEGHSKIAEAIHDSLTWLASFVARFFIAGALWFFSLTTELAIFAMWLAVPLWFFRKTEKAFMGFVTTLITSAIYPVTLLFSVFLIDALFATFAQLFLGDAISNTVTATGATGLAAVVGSAVSTVVGGPFVLMGVLGSGLLIAIIYMTAYIVAVIIICLKVPSITRKVMNGQLPIADFAQSTVGGLLAGGAVGAAVAAPAAALAAPAAGKLAASGAAKLATSPLGKVAADTAARTAESAGKLGVKPAARIGQRMNRMRDEGRGIFNDKMTARDVVSGVEKMRKRADKSQSLGTMKKSIGNATREVLAATAAQGDPAKYYMLRTTMNRQKQGPRGGNSGFGTIDDGKNRDES